MRTSRAVQLGLLTLAILVGSAAGGWRGPNPHQGQPLAPEARGNPTSPNAEVPADLDATLDEPAAIDLGARFAETGRFGGRTTAIELGEGVVYVGMGQRLGVFAVSPAGDWTLLGSSETLPGPIRSLVVAGRHVFAGLWDPPLLVSLDVADARQPRVLATLDMREVEPFLHDREIHVFDLALAGNLVYASLLNAIAIIDVADPAHPLARRAVRISVPFLRVTPGAGHGFGSSGNRLSVWSLADPVFPRFFRQLSLDIEIADIALVGSFAYVVGTSFADGSAVLTVFDARDPSALVPVHERPLDIAGARMLRLSVSAGHLYVVASDQQFSTVSEKKLVVDLDLADPALPIERGRHTLPAEPLAGEAFRDGMAYLALGEEGLSAVDLRRPGAPEIVGRYRLPRLALGFAARGGWAFAATRDGFMVLDVGDPRQPRVAATYASPAADEVNALVLDGDRVYLAYGSGGSPEAAARPGLAVIDVTDPRLPREIAFFRTPVDASAVAIANGLAYLVAGPGLRVVDFADLGRPREIGAYRTAGRPAQVEVRGSRAFVASNSDFGAVLEIVDVAEPTAPRRLSQTLFAGSGARGLALAGDTAYLLLGDQSLRVIDISDPSQPIESAATALSVFGRSSLSLQGRYLYVARFADQFNFFQQQAIVQGRVFLSILDVGSGAPRVVWQTEAFGNPQVAEGRGLAQGADGELVMLLPLGPPQVFLPVALDGGDAEPTPEPDRGLPATEEPEPLAPPDVPYRSLAGRP